ncbi:MAG: hypothetical protein Q4C01_07670 [Clostridia bacterium]|nr:hypothetical protein [Clostridia bacterium]
MKGRIAWIIITLCVLIMIAPAAGADSDMPAGQAVLPSHSVDSVVVLSSSTAYDSTSAAVLFVIVIAAAIVVGIIFITRRISRKDTSKEEKKDEKVLSKTKVYCPFCGTENPPEAVRCIRCKELMPKSGVGQKDERSSSEGNVGRLKIKVAFDDEEKLEEVCGTCRVCEAKLYKGMDHCPNCDTKI